jgi:uncharacterized protein YecT (DUF1311 family)
MVLMSVSLERIVALGIAVGLQLLIADFGASADDSCLQNQATMNACAEKRAAEKQAALDVAYQAALAAVRSRPSGAGSGDEMATGLILAQDAWIKSRDATCRFDAALLGGGGSIGGSKLGNCLSSLNDRRIIAFEKLVNCLTTPECKFPVGLYQFQIRTDAESLNGQ